MERTARKVSAHRRYETSRIIYEATVKKLSEFKGVLEYTSSYQAAFDKVAGLLLETFPYTRSSIKAYFQASMLMNIGSEYSNLVSSIQKDWKDAETTNLSETILQIIRHFEFIKSSTQDNVLRVTTSGGAHRAPKGSCTNPECLKKGLPHITLTDAGSRTQSYEPNTPWEG